MGVAEVLVALLSAYLTVGLLNAVVFITVGLQRVDDAVHGVEPLFRLLVLPGATLLWPLVLWRWAAMTKEG